VCKHIIRVNEYIIKINYNTDIQNIRENVIYKSLKGSERISKTERHYRPFKWFIISLGSSLTYICHLQIYGLGGIHDKDLSTRTL